MSAKSSKCTKKNNVSSKETTKNVPKADVKAKNRKINAEKKRLLEILEDVDENVKMILEVTINNLAYQRVKIEELEEIIKVNGVTEEYQNGANQWGKKISSEYEAYVQTCKLYSANIKQLKDFMPKEAKETTENLLGNFMQGKPT